jgi:hypothetical protein
MSDTHRQIPTKKVIPSVYFWSSRETDCLWRQISVRTDISEDRSPVLTHFLYCNMHSFVPDWGQEQNRIALAILSQTGNPVVDLRRFLFLLRGATTTSDRCRRCHECGVVINDKSFPR